MTDKPFYVYLHRDNESQIFYVGKARLGIRLRPQRAFSNRTRTPQWHERAANGFTVEIVKYMSSNEEANILERKLIREYGRNDLGEGPLVNLSDGEPVLNAK